MDFTTLENQFKVLGSETRLRVVNALIQSRGGLRFSEIAKALDIYPSTLEDHLKRLVESGIISRTDQIYRSTMNTERVYQIVKSLNDTCDSTYFSTHILSIDNDSLKERFLTLKFDCVYDLLSLMNRSKDVIDNGMKLAKAGGAMDMQLETSFFEFYPIDLKDTDVEVIFTKSILDDFLEVENKELFFKGFNPKRTRLYVVDDCSVAMMTSESFGALFLSNLDGTMDFTKGLFFSDQNAVGWLHDLFDYLKSTGEEFSPKEIRKVWK
ncbi:ArsR family transcriptional regulator [Candidatus Thorarchaeota archaeon]|nr:MAG: ArsR family transcriptional regulator [Candidatus Thorarchaeota archaeon]